MSVLDNADVRQALRQAWADSRPGTLEVHEEGGFIVRDESGGYQIERWPCGETNRMVVPPHSAGRRGAGLIIATFHTHPNPEPDYQQEPSLTDIRAVRGDTDLRHAEYEGEFVIAAEQLYRILPNGLVENLGDTRAILTVD